MKKLNVFSTYILFSISFVSFSQIPTEQDVIQNKVKGELSSLQLRDSIVLNVGDTVEIGLPTNTDRYRFLTKTMPCMTGFNCVGQFYMLPMGVSGSIVTIKNIKVVSHRPILLLSHGQGSVFEIRVPSIVSAIESKELIINKK